MSNAIRQQEVLHGCRTFAAQLKVMLPGAELIRMPTQVDLQPRIGLHLADDIIERILRRVRQEIRINLEKDVRDRPWFVAG